MKNYLEDKGIDLNKNKETRLLFGNKAEEYIFNDLKSKGINIKPIKEFEGYNTGMDLKQGDLFLPDKNLYIDVKFGRSVSMNSLKNFQGSGYLFVTGIFPGRPIHTNKTYYIKKESIKSLISKQFFQDLIKQGPLSKEEGKNSKKLIVYSKIPSGGEGIYINFDLYKNKILYQDLVNTLK